MSNGTPLAQPVRSGPMTLDEALPSLQAKVQEKGGQDSFKVKVQRQASFGAPLTHIASFANATIDHLASPETWLLMLSGGGPLYVITATHAGDQLPTCTFRPPNLTGATKEVDPNITSHPEWRGPPDLTFPTKGDRAVPTAGPAGVAPLFTMFGPPGDGARSDAARGPSSPPPGGTGQLDERFQLIQMQMQMQADRFEKLIADQAKSMERAVSGMAETVRTVAQGIAQRPVVPEKSIVEQLAAAAPVIAALGAIITPVIQKNREVAADDRKREAEERARREEREAQARKESAEMYRVMLEKSQNASSDMMKVITPMVEATAQMGRTVLQQVATMREITASGEPQEESLGSVLKAIAGAAAEVWLTKSQQEAERPLPQRQLPPGQPAQGAPQSQGDAEEGEEEETPEQRASRDHLAKMNPEEVVGRIVEAMKAKHEVASLVDGFLDAVQANKGVEKMIRDAGGTVAFFRAKLGDAWIGANANYVSQVIAKLKLAAKERGLTQ